MRVDRAVRSVGLAACFATACVLTGTLGALACLALGILGLAICSRRQAPRDRAGERGAWGQWLLCCFAYAAFVVCLYPLAELEAVLAAFVVLSPLFGTTVYVLERALFVDHAV